MVAATTPIAYVRFHGRNAATWNSRGGGAAQRFDYLYAEEELRSGSARCASSREQAEEAYAFFNNNNPDEGGREVAQAPTNAEMLRDLLVEKGLPVSLPKTGARAASG